MRVRAIKIGYYANSVIEKDQVFDLVPVKGFKQVHKRNEKTGEIISTKQVAHIFQPEEQFSENWMKEVKQQRKTIRLERVGKELGVAEKALTLEPIKHMHNGKKYGDEIHNPDPEDGDFEDDLEDDVDDGEDEGGEESPTGSGPAAQGSDSSVNVL